MKKQNTYLPLQSHQSNQAVLRRVSSFLIGFPFIRCSEDPALSSDNLNKMDEAEMKSALVTRSHLQASTSSSASRQEWEAGGGFWAGRRSFNVIDTFPSCHLLLVIAV